MQKTPTLEKFFEKLGSDETLSSKYTELLKAKDSEAIRELMKENGVSDEDMQTVAENLNSIDRFNIKLYEDEELAREYQELVERKDEASVISLMKKNGVTDEDLEAAKQKIETMAANGELSDEMLEEVAGGGDFGAFIGAGVGIVGGATLGAFAGAGIGAIAVPAVGAAGGALIGALIGAVSGINGAGPGSFIEDKINGT
jgi:hypothetical protein